MRGEKGRALHLMGLVSDGGVHSQQAHLYALLLAAKQHGVERVFVHAFLDGRDTLPTSGVGYLEKLQAKISEIGVGKIASVGGRYFAMDRDRRWERSKKAFDAIVGITEGGAYADPIARVKECYHNGVTDEFVEPFVVRRRRRESRWARCAMKMPASASTIAPTGCGRSRACWRATAA